jgi:hypothetical protein
LEGTLLYKSWKLSGTWKKSPVRQYEKPTDLARLTSLVKTQSAEIAGPIMMALGEEIDFEDKKNKYKGNESVAEVIREIYLTVRISTGTITELGGFGGHAKISSLPILRRVVEGCINATYFMSVGEGAAKDAHYRAIAIAKAYHNTDRTAVRDS